MFRLIGWILGLPWPVLVLMACGLFGSGHFTKQQAIAFEAEKAQALAEGQPAPVPLDAFGEEDVHPAREVHVTTWINIDHNYQLTRENRRGADTVRRMFVLFGPGDGPDSRVARGVITIDPGSVDKFVALLEAGHAGQVDGRMLVNLNGSREGSPDLADMVDDALAERGLHKDRDFLVLAPYLDGRDAALKPDPDAPARGMRLFGTLGGLMLVLALRNFARRRRKEEQERAIADDFPPVGGRAVPAGQPGPAQVFDHGPPPASEGWSPLAAVKAKQAAATSIALQPVAAAGADRGAGIGSRLWGGYRWLTKVSVALGLYMVVYLAFSPFTGPVTMGAVQEKGVVATVMQVFGSDAGTEPAGGGQAVSDAGAGDGAPATTPPVEAGAAGGVWPWGGGAGMPSATAGAGAVLILLCLGYAMARRRLPVRGGAVRGGDPWDRLSQRLR